MQTSVSHQLIAKYNVPAPRYTSYPTVPYWEQSPTEEEWKSHVAATFSASNLSDGISLYIHLPYCESLCTYCACNTRITVNHAVEKPYINALLKEWDMYLEVFGDTPKIRELHLGGGTPTFFSAAHLKELIEGILKKSKVCSDAEFSFEAHPANTTHEHLQTLYNLGFRRVSFGIQDFDDAVQDMINRFQTIEQVKAVVDDAREIGYTSVNFDLVYGLPLQTVETMQHTIELVNTLRPERIAFYSYAHVPWMKPGQRKFSERHLPADEEKRRLYELGKNRFLESGYEEIGMDHFALPGDALSQSMHDGSLHRNFMGYASHSTRLLVGLGTSSISDTWTAFGQNEKTVEAYIERVQSGHLPVIRGHILTHEDLVLRRHILNLMCLGETSWEKPDQQCEFLHDIAERLEEPYNDGLVEMEPYSLKVTQTGRAFLRNICMSFDARYQRRIPEDRIFSTSV